MFLSFFGLHTPGFLESLSELNWDDSWAHSRFRTAEGITAIVPPQLSHAVLNDSIAGVSVGREHLYSQSFNGPLVQCSLNLLRPIESSLDGRGEGAASFWSSRDVEGLDHDMIRRLFEEFAMEEDQEWNLMRLAFESLINVKRYVSATLLLFQTTDRISQRTQIVEDPACVEPIFTRTLGRACSSRTTSRKV
jgi:hypothetical protein